MIFNLFHSYSWKLYLSCHEQLGESLWRQYTLGNIPFEQNESSHLNEVTVSFCPHQEIGENMITKQGE